MDTTEILQKEYNKLQDQIKNVNESVSSQERVNMLNNSYSKRMSAYTRAVMAGVFGLAIAVLLNILKTKFSIIPDAVITFAYIIIFSSVLIYTMFILSDVYSRENTDFDKLDLDPPEGVSKAMRRITQNESERGNMDLLPGYCIGSGCCNSGTKYDSTTSKCTSCEAGKYSGPGAETCTNCEAGKYSEAGSATCTNCTAGQYSAAGSATCTLCESGKYSAAGSATCTGSCPENTYLSGQACLPCSAGQISSGGTVTTCTPKG
jgi:hypothetical protein